MKETLRFNESNDRLIIDILPSMKPIVKFGLAFQGIVIIAMSILFTTVILTSISEIPVASLLFIALCVIFFIAGKNYLKRVFYNEIIEVSKEQLTIIDKYFSSKDKQSFPISEISNISFVGQHKYTRHPLDNNTIDFTGLGIAEREAQYSIEDGTIEIFCNGVTRRFGKNIASWDAEEIVTRIERFTGNNLRLDDKMEKLLDSLDEQSNDEKYNDNSNP